MRTFRLSLWEMTRSVPLFWPGEGPLTFVVPKGIRFAHSLTLALSQKEKGQKRGLA